MPETITTLTGVEMKPGSNNQGAYVLSIFTDQDGKKFKTFDDGLASRARELIGPPVVIDFEVKTQQRNGRTFTDNFLNGIRDAAEVSTDGKTSDMIGTGNEIANRILAFKAAIDLASAVPEAFDGMDHTNAFVRIASVADLIYTWADRAHQDEPEPEPEPEPVTN